MNVSDQPGYEEIRGWLSTRCGIAYPEHKRDLLRQRLARVTHRFSYSDLNELSTNLIKNAVHDVQIAVMHAASTNHTYFYREKDVLDRFAKEILPTFANRNELRIWSAAASSGDEAYTIAMIAAETLGPSFLQRLKILGTDISEPVIHRAEEAIYSSNNLEHMDPSLRTKYFKPTGIEQFRVNSEIRDTCTFRRLNLKATPYPFQNSFQVVFCRNLLYYFDRHDQIATLNALYEVTEPGGWLITSVTESIRDLGTPWKQVAAGIHRRVA